MNALKIGLAWIIIEMNMKRAWWHNGGTGGFSSFAGFSKNPAVGVIVLSNRSNIEGEVDKIGMKVLEALMGEFSGSGMTLVFASHNLGQVKRLATRVCYLERGRLLADLPVLEFFNGPRLLETSCEADLFVKGELG